MEVTDPEAWVRHVERLYQNRDETTASYVIRAEGRKCREFGVDIYWVNDDGLIYHKHTCEVVDDYRGDALEEAAEACAAHPGTPA
jgi:hypothetical protein